MTATSRGLPWASVRPLTFKRPKPLLVYARLSLRFWGEVQHPSPGIVYDSQNGKINPLGLFLPCAAVRGGAVSPGEVTIPIARHQPAPRCQAPQLVRRRSGVCFMVCSVIPL